MKCRSSSWRHLAVSAMTSTKHLKFSTVAIIIVREEGKLILNTTIKRARNERTRMFYSPNTVPSIAIYNSIRVCSFIKVRPIWPIKEQTPTIMGNLNFLMTCCRGDWAYSRTGYLSLYKYIGGGPTLCEMTVEEGHHDVEYEEMTLDIDISMNYTLNKVLWTGTNQ